MRDFTVFEEQLNNISGRNGTTGTGQLAGTCVYEACGEKFGSEEKRTHKFSTKIKGNQGKERSKTCNHGLEEKWKERWISMPIEKKEH